MYYKIGEPVTTSYIRERVKIAIISGLLLSRTTFIRIFHFRKVYCSIIMLFLRCLIVVFDFISTLIPLTHFNHFVSW